MDTHTQRYSLIQEETHTPEREIYTHTLRENNKLGERNIRSHTGRDTQTLSERHTLRETKVHGGTQIDTQRHAN